jgi:hypothetical protein
MADESQADAALPDVPDDADVEIQTCAITFQVHPKPVLTKIQLAHEFSVGLTKYLNVQNTKTGNSAWNYEASFLGSPECRFNIVIQEEGCSFQLHIPQKMSEEWIEQRFQFAFDTFAKSFEPQLLMGLNINLLGIMDLKGDARRFLVEKVMHMDPSRFSLFERPFVMTGLHFFFPPFKTIPAGPNDKETETAWTCDVKIESLMADPNKLWLNSIAQWMDGKAWQQCVPSEINDRLGQAIDYLKRCVNQFVTGKPGRPHSETDDGTEQ